MSARQFGYTDPNTGESYPGYVNITKNSDVQFSVAVREPRHSDGQIGHLSVMTMPREEAFKLRDALAEMLAETEAQDYSNAG